MVSKLEMFSVFLTDSWIFHVTYGHLCDRARCSNLTCKLCLQHVNKISSFYPVQSLTYMWLPKAGIHSRVVCVTQIFCRVRRDNNSREPNGQSKEFFLEGISKKMPDIALPVLGNSFAQQLKGKCWTRNQHITYSKKLFLWACGLITVICEQSKKMFPEFPVVLTQPFSLSTGFLVFKCTSDSPS